MLPIDQEIVDEIESQRPRIPVGLLSREEKDRLVERGLLGLYRWYSARSQETRNWNPDRDIDWKNLRQDHNEEILTILDGFFAVEQYVPDYVENIVEMIRTSHGRSHFQIKWGSEEAKHADLWHNALLFSGQRTAQRIRDYMGELRSNAWTLPWDCPMRMLFYTVFQERATQINYLNLGVIAKGKSLLEKYKDSGDPVLVKACQVIAIDEAAHYNFFLEAARLYLYYYPAQAIEAMSDVLRHFAMPAGNIIPNYDRFAEVVHKAAIYGPREHAKDVVQTALSNLGFASRKALENGIKRIRLVPDEDGNLRHSAIFEGLDWGVIESSAKRLFGKVQQYESELGFDRYDPIEWKPAY